MARRPPRRPTSTVPSVPPPSIVDDDEATAPWIGERARRLALGLAAAVLTARAYWPCEPDMKAEAGTALGWDLAILALVGLALASSLIGGTFRFRWSWADAGVIALMLLTGLSAAQAYDRRVAINLAWDWGAVGLLYFLLRTLPRTPGESRAIAFGLVATAVALSVYGLYQVGVELPATRSTYNAHRLETLRMLGIEPNTQAQILYEKRLLGSNEPIATFALANSLAGYLLGPLVLLWVQILGIVLAKGTRGGRFAMLATASLLAMTVLACLILSKCRTAYVGLAVGIAIVAWRQWRSVSGRLLAKMGLVSLLAIFALATAGLATGRLDREVLTQSSRSLRFRLEYWVGAWRVIRENRPAFWNGHGPGNFNAPYLKHKVPEASEEISDPHNLILEVWAMAGTPAMLALLFALGFGFRDLLGPPRDPGEGPGDEEPSRPQPGDDSPSPPIGNGWLIASAAGGWLVVVLLGRLNPFEGDLFFRWLCLGAAWVGAVLLGLPAWRRRPIAASGFGAAAVATAVHLLGAGGIGFGAVAAMLWALVALGLNLRDDRPCGRVRRAGRLAAFGLALAWAALAGCFAGAVLPFWKSEAKILEAEDALRARPPRFEAADLAYQQATALDKFSARPWKGIAYLKFQEWSARGSRVDDLRWQGIPFALAEAVSPPRNPESWSLHRERAIVTRQLLEKLGANLKPGDSLRYRASIVESSRRAALLYPSNATLHAQLAIASADIGMFADAVSEADRALELDARTPHEDKKLANPLRKAIREGRLAWMNAAANSPSLNAVSPRR